MPRQNDDFSTMIDEEKRNLQLRGLAFDVGPVGSDFRSMSNAQEEQQMARDAMARFAPRTPPLEGDQGQGVSAGVPQGVDRQGLSREFQRVLAERMADEAINRPRREEQG